MAASSAGMRAPALVGGQRCQPALRDLLAAVHRDLDQPVVERGIGEALEQRIGIGQIHARRGRNGGAASSRISGGQRAQGGSATA
jgi:hypothetical protein